MHKGAVKYKIGRSNIMRICMSWRSLLGRNLEEFLTSNVFTYLEKYNPGKSGDISCIKYLHRSCRAQLGTSGGLSSLQVLKSITRKIWMNFLREMSSQVLENITEEIWRNFLDQMFTHVQESNMGEESEELSCT